MQKEKLVRESVENGNERNQPRKDGESIGVDTRDTASHGVPVAEGYPETHAQAIDSGAGTMPLPWRQV